MEVIKKFNLIVWRVKYPIFVLDNDDIVEGHTIRISYRGNELHFHWHSRISFLALIKRRMPAEKAWSDSSQ